MLSLIFLRPDQCVLINLIGYLLTSTLQHLACSEGHLALAQFLLESKADLTKRCVGHDAHLYFAGLIDY